MDGTGSFLKHKKKMLYTLTGKIQLLLSLTQASFSGTKSNLQEYG